MAGKNSSNVTSIAAAAKAAKPAPDLRKSRDAGPDPVRKAPPDDCPVRPLGFMGQKQFFLDHAHQLISLGTEFRKGEVYALFGSADWPFARWSTKKQVVDPNTGEKEWVPNKFDQNGAQDEMIEWCAAKGIFDPTGKIRGRGAHLHHDGGIVLHMGNRVLIAGYRGKTGEIAKKTITQKTGEIDRFIYPSLPSLPPPDDVSAIAGEDGDGEKLADLFGRWYWHRPSLAPQLLLGEIAAMMVCGALEWRPHVWLTGPTAAGKSLLQRLFKYVLDDWCLQSNDSTEAAVRQLLKQDTLPVLIDEAEADADSDKQKRIIQLARLASSGGMILRGGADHKGQEFRAQSCFLFSSILHSPLQPQDRNRIAILDMMEVPEGAKEPFIDKDFWRAAGRRMHRRMIEQWPRFSKTLVDYKKAIAAQGYKGREQDQYGTLLACADLLLHDEAPRDCAFGVEIEGATTKRTRADEWAASLSPVLATARAEGEDDGERCVAHLTSVPLPGQQGLNEPVGVWLRRAIEPIDDEMHGEAWNRIAQAKLKAHGLALRQISTTTGGGTGSIDPVTREHVYVAVAYPTNVGARALFKGTEWDGGGWKQSLARVHGAETGIKARFAGKAENCVLVPIEALIDWTPADARGAG